MRGCALLDVGIGSSVLAMGEPGLALVAVGIGALLSAMGEMRRMPIQQGWRAQFA